MGQSIVQLQMMGDALRSSGYKSIDSALAEIVDNSIEAKATNVFIIMRQEADPLTGHQCVTEFGILDNGTGMEIDLLAGCLGIGYTTKGDRRGMGRFGVGLPQASMHVTPRVEVYSWTKPIQADHFVRRVWLDVDMIKSGAQEEIADPDYIRLPDFFKDFLQYTSDKKYDFTKHGTLVYWKNCDNIKPKTLDKLVETLFFNLGRKFRHMINDGSHTIKLISVGHKGHDIDRNIMPNDPMFLMDHNFALGNPNEPEKISYGYQAGYTEPIFERFSHELYEGASYTDGRTVIKQTYRDKITGQEMVSDIEISFSIVKQKFYGPAYIKTGDPGAKPIGKYTKSLLGVSVVRAGREIDFGRFDFYEDISNPQHRWWGCEISFDPVLDEIFGVASNKQQVELHSDSADERDIDDDSDDNSIWRKLANVIQNELRLIMGINAARRKNVRTKAPVSSERTTLATVLPTLESENIAEAVEKTGWSSSTSASAAVRNNTPVEQRRKLAERELNRRGVDDPSDEQIDNLLSRKVAIRYDGLGKSARFVDVDFSLGNIQVKINVDHLFFIEYVEAMDSKQKTALELFVMSLAMALDATDGRNKQQNEALLNAWDSKLRDYLKQIHVV